MSSVPAVSATVNYWVLDRASWPGVLDRHVALGFAAIAAFVPWNAHMPAPDQQDWGANDARKDLTGFLALCKERGLKVILRPGPTAGPSVPDYGYPRWVIDDEQVAARDAVGDKIVVSAPNAPLFTAPSIASKVFYGHVGGWLDAVLPRITPFLASANGPVAAVQVDYELNFFSRLEPFAADYNVDVVALYKQWINDYQAQPPRRWDRYNIPAILEWCRFREWLLVYGLEKLATMFRERGVKGVPLLHSLQANAPHGVIAPGASPFNLAALERVVDVVGVDTQALASGYQNTRKWARYLHAASRQPSMNSVAASASMLNPAQVEFQLRAMLMHGVKAINRDATPGPSALAFNKLQASLSGSRKQAQVLILAMRDYARFSAASSLDAPRLGDANAPDNWVSLEDYGFSEPIGGADLDWYRAVEAALWTLGYTSDIGDDDMPLENLRRYKLIICPALDFMRRSSQQKLLDYVRRGGYVVYGPQRPRFDENLKRFSMLGDMISPFAGQPNDWNFESLLLEELIEANIPEPIARDEQVVEVVSHLLPDGRSVVFVANSTPGAQMVGVEADLIPFDENSPLVDRGGMITLPPFTIGVYALASRRSRI